MNVKMMHGKRSSSRASSSNKWTVHVCAKLWDPSVTPQCLEYCEVEKLEDVLWEISVNLNVPETAASVRELMDLPEVASVVRADDVSINTNRDNYCTLCHKVGARNIKWTVENSMHRREFFALLTKSLGITSETLKFQEEYQDMIDLCCSCTAHLQTLTRLFQQLKAVEENFKSEASNLQASIVKGIGPPSQKSWNLLREHVVTSYLGCSAAANVEENNTLDEIIGPSGTTRACAIKTPCVDELPDNNSSSGDDTQYFMNIKASDDDSEDDSMHSRKIEKNEGSTRVTSSEGRRSKGGRSKHPVWNNFTESWDGKWKVAECRKCKQSFKCPQADRLIRHVHKCNRQQSESKLESRGRKRKSAFVDVEDNLEDAPTDLM